MPVKIGSDEGMSRDEMLRLIESFPDDVIFKIDDGQAECSDCQRGGEVAESHIWFHREGPVVYLYSANLEATNKDVRSSHDQAHAALEASQVAFVATKAHLELLDLLLKGETKPPRVSRTAKKSANKRGQTSKIKPGLPADDVDPKKTALKE